MYWVQFLFFTRSVARSEKKLVIMFGFSRESYCVENVRIISYSVQIQENTDENNSEYGHFSRKVKLNCKNSAKFLTNSIPQNQNKKTSVFSKIPLMFWRFKLVFPLNKSFFPAQHLLKKYFKNLKSLISLVSKNSKEVFLD